MTLNTAPKVHSTIYGSLVGFDTPIESIKKGWAKSFTGYIGYNGSTQNFSGVHTVQNGGLLGATMTLYKGNFFSATTLSTGASIAETNSMFGHEDTTMLLGGAANKTGYNFEFKNGKFIIQPNVMVAYTFVNTFNYTNAAGVKIESDPMHTIQVSPGIRLMANTPKGWQPYIAINMVMNFMDKSKVTADNIVLPGISSRPYVQYGLGVQKKYKEHFMAFGQAMFQSGGRHGVSLTAGLRWCIGGDKDKHEKVQKNQNKIVKENSVKQEITNSNKTIIKQLDVSSRNRLTTQTQKQGVIKNL